MRRVACALLLAAPVALVALPARSADPATDDSPVKFTKTVIDKKFRAEGVTVADVNKDGKPDILTGDVWYEAPDWKMHAIRDVKDYGSGEAGYSRSFGCFAQDFNGDGYPDLIVIPFPGEPCYWYENPKGGPGTWTPHLLWHSACNETPQYVDLLGNGKKVLVMGWQPKGKSNEGQMAYFTPGADPTQPWDMHPISEPSQPGKEIPGTQKFSHGLGVGDINGDGRTDVIIPNGWWEQPEKLDGTPWKFHPAPLGEACADMYAYDLDGDGKADVISSSAHKFGIWSYLQRPGKDGNPAFVKQDLFPKLVSETHALHCVDMNGDGLKDLVTGKRFWSHGRNEPGANDLARLYWFEAKKKDGIVSFTPHVIDEDSGIGTQFEVTDYNGDGKPDIVVSNKKGTFLFIQQGK
jgi:hypothetical protein